MKHMLDIKNHFINVIFCVFFTYAVPTYSSKILTPCKNIDLALFFFMVCDLPVVKNEIGTASHAT